MNEVEKLQNKIKELEQQLDRANEVEQLLHKSQRELNSLLSNLQGFVFRCRNDKNWTMEYLSDGFGILLGYAANDIIQNKKLTYSDIIHKEDRDKVWGDIQLALKNKKKWLLNYRLVHKNGTTIWVWEKGQGIFAEDGTLEFLEGVVIDISERYEIENKYRKIYNTIIDTFYESSLDGTILDVSPSITNILGYSREYLLGRNTSEVYADTNQREHLLNELLANKSVKNHELVLIHKNGHPINCVTNVVLIPGKNNEAGKIIGSFRDISLWRSVESENTKLLSAIEQSPVSVVITDLKGEVEYFNPKFSEVTGYSKEEIIGHTLQILKSGTHPDSMYKELWNTISKGNVWKGEFQNKRKDGSLFWESETIAPVKDSTGKIINYIAVKEDISSIKSIQNRLKESEEHYRKLFFEAPNGYQSLDIDGNIIDVNPAWCELLGYEREDVVGKRVCDFLIEESKESFQSIFIDFKSSGVVNNQELTYLHKDGREIIVIINGRIGLNTDGSFKQTHCILSDISELKLYEKQLQNAKFKAEESDRLKTAFLANMSHEIRTPMNAILGFSNLLKEPSISREEMDDYINIINQRGNDLLQIISDIIDISRIEAGDIQMARENISINNFLKELQSGFRKILEFNNKHNVQILLEASELPDEAVIVADKVRLKQVFDNLIQNSIKFTSKGYIKIGYKKGINKIEFYVEDTGIGIEKDKQDIVFERFRQANDTHTKDFGGTGLGLAISRNIVNLLGGEMTLISTYGKGTTFFFSIPFSNK